MEVTHLAPPSVQLVPAKAYNGAPIGTSYDVRAYAGTNTDGHKNVAEKKAFISAFTTHISRSLDPEIRNQNLDWLRPRIRMGMGLSKSWRGGGIGSRGRGWGASLSGSDIHPPRDIHPFSDIHPSSDIQTSSDIHPSSDLHRGS
ncbi:unnamed protein product [Bemisia tabaci]|uniref:Uncharacterized protein n=1 Tax=Bemisia tabaci TaxID=7038 RepID=A0A9P0AH85_BEMTA|nr:unnamed protein product [Bemisia tabaci]